MVYVTDSEKSPSCWLNSHILLKAPVPTGEGVGLLSTSAASLHFGLLHDGRVHHQEKQPAISSIVAIMIHGDDSDSECNTTAER